MAANVETMFYTREVPWHGLGTRVEDSPSSEDALKLAGLDWDVIPKPLFTEGASDPIEGFVANVRSTDNTVLGVVSEKYKAVQNKTAFAFTDALVGTGEVRYETAGALAGGRKVWMLAKLTGTTKILGDQVDPYLLFSNNHEGTGAIRVAVTPIRVVCQNTLNIALRNANRAWSTKHMGDMDTKLREAERTLNMSRMYMAQLAEEADLLSQYTLRKDQIELILDALFPIEDDATDRVKATREQSKDEILTLVNTSDLQKFGKNNAWAFVNGVTDWAAHRKPLRNTSSFTENQFDRVTAGHPILDQAYDLVRTMMKAA